MRERKHSPMYFALWSMAGALLLASTWLLSFLRIARGWPRAVAFGIPTAVGLAAYFWGMKRLNGASWSEEEVAPVWAIFENPFLKCATLILAFAALLPFVFHGRDGGAIMLLFPSYAWMGVRYRLARSKPRKNDLRDWRDFKPIQSEHWGESVRPWGGPQQ